MAKSITLVSKIIDNKGTLVDSKTTSGVVEPFCQTEITQTGPIEKPLLWSPETPILYKVQTEVAENGNIVDTYETIFGVRTVEINQMEFS